MVTKKLNKRNINAAFRVNIIKEKAKFILREIPRCLNCRDLVLHRKQALSDVVTRIYSSYINNL